MKLPIALAVLAAACALPLAATASMSPELGAKLTGGVEVPKGSPTAHGIVNLDLKAGKRQVCWTFQVVGLDKTTAAHIHKAPAGKAGPVVVPFGGAFKTKGCTTASKSLIEAIESHPNSYYVNVHTVKYPNGAIRGQLVAGMVHM
jgi:hypothetical protein